jgi:sortase A
MTIPKLGVRQIVVEGTSSALTAQGPGHYRGSALPGRPGNSVIMGRRTTYGSPFGLLDSLRPGDAIQVATGVGSWVYTVHSVSEVLPGAADVLGATTDNRLTLVTSSPPYLATGRLAVVAYLSGSPAAQQPQASPMLTTSEYGLTGEPGALAGLIVWTEILAGALFLAVRLSRRLPRRVMWLLYAPIFLALAFAVSGTLSRLLPATF